MQIIVLHPRLPRVRHFTLSRGKVLAGIALLCLVVALVSSALTWIVARSGMTAPARAPGDDAYLRANLNVLAIRVGEIQARMVRLDALGERVSGLAGIAPKEFNFQQPPGRGGLAASAQSRTSSLPELQLALARLSDQAEQHADYFDVVASTLLDRRSESRRVPRVLPVASGYDASGFGWRFDPFSGRRTPHDGVDFSAPTGTPIVAAAGGVVVAAEWHPEYGNLIDIDHGNGLKTRYAHASKLQVSSSLASRSPWWAPPGAPPARTCISRCMWTVCRKTRIASWPSPSLRRPRSRRRRTPPIAISSVEEPGRRPDVGRIGCAGCVRAVKWRGTRGVVCTAFHLPLGSGRDPRA